jgi:hypothetical protein
LVLLSSLFRSIRSSKRPTIIMTGKLISIA